MPRVLLALLCTATLPLALAAGAAPATEANRFSASIEPTAVQPLSTNVYAVRITNRPASQASADNAHVSVPDGFVVNATSLSATTTAAGSCPAATWNVALNPPTIDASAPDADSELCPGGRLTIAFNAGAPSAEATYTWTSGLFDGSTAFALQGAQPTVAVDGTTPPAPTITAQPSDPSNDPAPSFSFTDGDDTATFVCQLDGGTPSACESPTGYSGLEEGAHTFAVQAVDPAGNQSTVTSYTWTIDVTPPPAPTITSAPPAVTDSTSATFSFLDGDASAGFQCRLDSAGFSDCTSPVTYEQLAQGVHTFRVKAIDPAGNESTVTSYTWTIDLTNPVVTIDPASEPHDPTNQTSASFVFTSNKPNSTFECRLDGADFSPCSSPETYTGLADGRHSFAVRATDQLGHIGLPSTYDWTVDTVAPVTTLTSNPPPVSNSPSATFEFTSSEPSSSFACSLDDGPFAACASPQIYVGLADGSHVFRIEATDLAGNTGVPVSYSWQVVTTPPPDTVPPGPVASLRRIVSYRLLKLDWSEPTDPDLAFVRVSRSRSPGTPATKVVYQGKGTAYADRRFQNGTYYRYEIRAYDTSGNVSSLVRVVVPPAALLRSPHEGAIVKAPPLLLWAGVRRATYYNVQLYRGSQKVLSAWPKRARLKTRAAWRYKGRKYRLQKGVYRWWVWPAFGPRSRGSYGPLLGTSTFVVR
jgi:hypothetical protein